MVTDFAFREDFRSLRSQLELAASLDEKLKCVKSRNEFHHQPQFLDPRVSKNRIIQNPH